MSVRLPAPHLSLVLTLLLVVGIALPGAAVAAPSLASSRAAAGTGALQTDATSGYLEGIDVSHWQNTIDWTKVAAAGKKFAMIKATDGIKTSTGSLYVDPLYATNHSKAKTAGLWTGAYHFARPDATAQDAIIEARHFASHMNPSAGDLIPALDLEDSGGLSIAALQTWVTTFLNEVTAQIGVRPMIYTSPAFWKKYMGDTRALADAGYKTLWVAHWNTTTPWVPAQNWGGRGWTFWQYSSTGTVSGISTRVDLDRYNGTDLQLVAYSAFKLTATSGGQVKQGQSGSSTVGIVRTNFDSQVALDVAGLPAGTTAAFNASPTTGTKSTMTVTTDASTTPTGSYPLTITGVGGGLTRTTKLTLVVADGIPPTVVAPWTKLLPGSTLGTSVPILVSWGASDPSGLSSQSLQRSVNAGSWSTVSVASTAVRSMWQSLAVGSSVRHRVRATDRLANTSAWATGPLVRTAVTQQGSTAIHYSGTWTTQAASSASGGSTRYATRAGASATFAFSGASIAWVATRGPTRGSARVYLDGVDLGTVSLYSSSGHSRSIVFARNFGTTGSHTIKIVVLGTAGHPRVDLDAFVRLFLS